MSLFITTLLLLFDFSYGYLTSSRLSKLRLNSKLNTKANNFDFVTIKCHGVVVTITPQLRHLYPDCTDYIQPINNNNTYYGIQCKCYTEYIISDDIGLYENCTNHGIMNFKHTQNFEMQLLSSIQRSDVVIQNCEGKQLSVSNCVFDEMEIGTANIISLNLYITTLVHFNALNTSFVDANLNYLNMQNAVFGDVYMTGIYLQNSLVSKTSFDKCTIGTQKSNIFEDVVFSSCSFSKTKFELLKSKNMILEGGILRDVTFLNSEFVGFEAKKPTLENVNFDNLIFTNCNINVKVGKDVTFSNSKFNNVTFIIEGIDEKFEIKFINVLFENSVMNKDVLDNKSGNFVFENSEEKNGDKHKKTIIGAIIFVCIAVVFVVVVLVVVSIFMGLYFYGKKKPEDKGYSKADN
ncbi:hypothetical protein EIN_200760 [Entamoeba invadens IP1]|uniref:Uncharacterized protein n=1 Tax=Entamoeba invadens IP1 TaxID=370355 RepID=L7FJZ4_ENTIV|nr:hypothetical protein EIN_200760 [Entamoeba invadens IP1]ELP83638.1 hypothetical protein EIN_200760 [Entamoeba invadens IP1]|eukprot:XP_004182984.1 hypothetical protein EIN_200760 [Entamoeba invadens IP1]